VRVVGVDENGLGPLLGPLVVTAVSFEARSYDREAFWALAGPDLPAADSKVLFSRGSMARAERATLAWLDLLGLSPTSRDDLAGAIGLVPEVAPPCPDPSAPACRPAHIGIPIWSAGPGGRAPEGARDRLDRAGVRVRAARQIAICPGLYNRETRRPGKTKLRLDFDAMMRLVSREAEDAPGGLLALCGKIGSTRRYGPQLEAAFPGRWRALGEEAAESAYEVDGIGAVRFVRDADSLHLPVAVASMIGKYAREIEMLGLNRLLGWSEGRAASGYRDPVTARFVRETGHRRAEIGLPDRCFLRGS